jgi:thioredoxin reductase (NADPH)
VYGASEGLDTLVLDAVGPGGQAGTSSRIENFFGFPSGVSGSDLVEQGTLQATRLGATINAPCAVSALQVTCEGYEVSLTDGTTVPCRSVVIASGVQYRQLPLERLAEFEGAGVYYAATDIEARVCAGQPVTVVGGGNSAGQAAIYLAQRGCEVTVVIRGDELTSSMSSYLVDRIDAAPDIAVAPRTQVVGLHGERSLTAVTLRSGALETVTPCFGMFSFIGAAPFTGWLKGVVELDDHGFVVTDRDVTTLVCVGVDLLPFETSQPGVFAIGDVRHGSMKRVAAAVGEGSSAIRSVHDHLARSRMTQPE